MPTLHIVTTKQATFRGKPERFSNGYNFQTGSVEITADVAYDVASAIVTMERSFTSNSVAFPYIVGGVLGEDALYTNEIEDGGPHGTVSAAAVQLELCTLAQSKIGPKRYLMKYYHGAAPSAAAHDAVDDVAAAAMETALAKLTDGTLPHSVVACRPNGAVATEPYKVDPWVRVHQLKRRGKRP